MPANSDHRDGRTVTIRDVATRAGVAISSVSSAMNGRPGVSDATRARIQNAARDLGYIPSLRGRSLSAKRAFAVGLVVQRDPDVLEADPFFGGFIAGIESLLSERGYALVLQVSTSTQDDEDRYRQLALGRRVDGVYLNELTVEDKRLGLARELGLPAVAITESSLDWQPTVVRDPSQAIRMLVDEFIRLGHRRFAYVGGPSVYLHANSRRKTWNSALSRYAVDDAQEIESDFAYDGGARAADMLLNGPRERRPTAVFCANDLMAVGFLIRAREMGLRVPADVSVAGFDGTSLGTYIRPTLTTISTSPRTLGRVATELLLDAINGITSRTMVVPDSSRLVIRDSIGAAPIGE